MSLLGLEPEDSHVRAAKQDAGGAAALGMDHSEFDEMQRITRSRSILKRLRARGIGSVIWGLIAIGVGTNAMQVNPLNGILLALGIFLVAEGVWIAFAPTPIGLRVDGVAVLLVSVWNIVIAIMSMLGGQPGIVWGIVGIAQFSLAIRSFSTYDSVSGFVHDKPTAETLRRLDQMTEALRVADVSSDPSIISFSRLIHSDDGLGWKNTLFRVGNICHHPIISGSLSEATERAPRTVDGKQFPVGVRWNRAANDSSMLLASVHHKVGRGCGEAPCPNNAGNQIRERRLQVK